MKISKMYKWFKLLKNDHDWDYDYLFRILLLKLQMMQKALQEEVEPRIVKEINIAIFLLKRIIEDKYIDEDLKEHEKEYGEMKSRKVEYIEDRDLTLYETYFEKASSQKEAKKALARIGQKAANRRLNEIRFLFNYIGKHIEGWWS